MSLRGNQSIKRIFVTYSEVASEERMLHGYWNKSVAKGPKICDKTMQQHPCLGKFTKPMFRCQFPSGCR